jgi:hypothetical protein
VSCRYATELDLEWRVDRVHEPVAHEVAAAVGRVRVDMIAAVTLAAVDLALPRAARRVRYTALVDTSGLPGADLIERGLADLAAGRESEASLLVLIGRPRLRVLGLEIGDPPAPWSEPPHDPLPEHRLYERLAQAGPDAAHSRYNALIRTLVSFERAAACVG